MEVNYPPLFCPESGVRLIHSPSSLALADRDKAAYAIRYIHGAVAPGLPEEQENRMAFGSLYHQAMEVLVGERKKGASWWEAYSTTSYKMEPWTEELDDCIACWMRKWKGVYPEPLADVSPEIPFLYPLPRKAPCGVHYHLFGIVDWPAVLPGGQKGVVERKTTSRSPSSWYWNQHRDSWQARIYALAARELLGQAHVLLDVVKRPAKTVPVACMRSIFTYSREELKDLVDNVQMMLVELELAQQEGIWRRSYWSYGAGMEDLLAVPASSRLDGLERRKPEHPVERWLNDK